LVIWGCRKKETKAAEDGQRRKVESALAAPGQDPGRKGRGRKGEEGFGGRGWIGGLGVKGGQVKS